MPSISGSLETQLPPHADTVAKAIQNRVAATPDALAFASPGPNDDWSVTYTWRQAGDEMTKLGAGLIALGLKPADRVAIASNTRTEWILADGGVMLAGGANTTIYPSGKALSQRDAMPELTRIIMIDGEGDGDFVLSWDEVRKLGEEKLAESPGVIDDHVAQLTSESLATMIYTSGTTGRPKGVQLPHRCWVFEGASIDQMKILTPDDVHFLWLPLAHSFGKVLIAAAYQVGMPTYCDGRVPKLVENLPKVQPTVMAGVPRIYEKIYQSANAKAKAGGGAKAKIFDWAFSGRVRLFVSGSAALNGDVARWFDAAGLPILEGYGLTENSAAACVVRPEDIVFGKVGSPLPGTQVRIAEDGEVLLKGPHVMQGYWNLPEANAEALLPDGWLATGDIGELDEAGRLKITDRKKDLVKTSGGKYIAPGQIAAQFKVISPLASNLVVHASDRNYATGLVSLDPEALEKFAAEKGLTGDFATLSQTPEVRAVIQANIDTLNSQLNRWETIKKFTILDRDLSEEAGELTASLKVKRKVVEEHFAELLEAMYKE
ncbi:MAG: AMP-dependent synthetase/ligase [Candidatus Nanopelagicales bacterium]|nr:AMP-dependent synthetase/ligase [Candidatus Nanopelagicales bacterium]